MLVRKTDHAGRQVGQAGQGDGPGGEDSTGSTGCRGLAPTPAALPDQRLQMHCWSSPGVPQPCPPVRPPGAALGSHPCWAPSPGRAAGGVARAAN
jgi:hypothetical protein